MLANALASSATRPSTAFAYGRLRCKHGRHDAFLPAMRTGATGTGPEVVRACDGLPRADPSRRHARGVSTGQVVYELKHPFKNGTTHFVFEPLEFLAKLAALVPRPRANLTRYHGVLAPNAKYRNLVVPSPNRWVKRKCRVAAKPSPPSTKTDSPLAPLSWAERLKRVFKLDIELCPKCGGQLRVIAAITEPDVINKILDHVHQPQAPPRQPPRRVTGSITSEIQFDAL